MFRHILRPVLQKTRSGARAYHIPRESRPPHMDELPVPSGSWQEAYNKDQKKYNMQLVAGIASLAITIAFGRSTGLLWLNYAPPKPKPKE
ncbi:uncharacterized protein LOC128880853 [Hylaeus volcanicus]|uniref:uncharacterized protein LOC128880853 n=1 Tax=Hylaeus volcanicus TaxID=313075 RepID=UPI0023B80E65|nr:uncharacterized protein LOC128880853 [Hylaeus volcanicus]